MEKMMSSFKCLERKTIAVAIIQNKLKIAGLFTIKYY